MICSTLFLQEYSIADALITLSRRGLIYIFRYGHKHSSPNAGYPEAALAGILNCRLAVLIFITESSLRNHIWEKITEKYHIMTY